ncbi:MAG: RNA ligase family protein [Pseudomonadota bacterium]
MRVKYPRTLHHPSSAGVQSDDKIARDLSLFDGAEVVVTEKMDGENTTLYVDGFHARSIDIGKHPGRDWLARFHGQMGYQIPQGWRVCGENLYARHSVGYDALPSYFLGFSIWDAAQNCLGWDDTVSHFAAWGVTPVSVLWRGTYDPGKLAEVTQSLVQTGRKAGSCDWRALSRWVNFSAR